MEAEDDIIEVVKLALPHDFGSTLTYLDRSVNKLKSHFALLSPYTTKVRVNARLLKMKNSIAQIDKKFDEFWNEHETSTDLKTVKNGYEKTFEPEFTFLVFLAEKTRTVLLDQVLPKVKRRDKLAHSAIKESVDILERIAYFAKRSNYYIEGMHELVDLKMPDHLEFTNLNRIISQLSELNQYEHDGELNVTVLGKLPTIKVDYSHAFTWLSNLMKNSIKYTSDQNCEIFVFTSDYKFPDSKDFPEFNSSIDRKFFDQQIAIHFFDRGMGIKHESLEAIFRPYKRAHDATEEVGYKVKGDDEKKKYQEEHATRKYTGIGIGLSLVQRVVDFYGGQVYASSTLNKWTCITAVFPRKIILNDY